MNKVNKELWKKKLSEEEDKWEIADSEDSNEENFVFKVMLEKIEEEDEEDKLKHKLIFENNSDGDILFLSPPLLDSEVKLADIIVGDESFEFSVPVDSSVIIESDCRKEFSILHPFNFFEEKIKEEGEIKYEITLREDLDCSGKYDGEYIVTKEDFNDMMSADIIRKFL